MLLWVHERKWRYGRCFVGNICSTNTLHQGEYCTRSLIQFTWGDRICLFLLHVDDKKLFIYRKYCFICAHSACFSSILKLRDVYTEWNITIQTFKYFSTTAAFHQVEIWFCIFYLLNIFGMFGIFVTNVSGFEQRPQVHTDHWNILCCYWQLGINTCRNMELAFSL